VAPGPVPAAASLRARLPKRPLDRLAVTGEIVVGLYVVGLLITSSVPTPLAVARSAAVALVVGVAVAAALRGTRPTGDGRVTGNAVAGALALAIGSLGIGLSAGAGLSALPIEGLSTSAVAGVVVLVAALFVAAAGTTWLFRPLRGGLRLAALPVWLEVVQFWLLPVFLAGLAAHPPHTPLWSADPARAQDVRFAAADGTILAGWLTLGTNGRTVIVIPGGGATRDNTLGQSAVLVRHGYTVLNYDPRGVGESGGREMLFGWGWESDLGSAIDFLATRPDVDLDRVGALGLSIGAQVAIAGAATDGRLRAVVAEGAAARVCGDLVFWGDDAQGLLNRYDHCAGWFLAGLLSGASEPVTLARSAAQLDATPTLLIAADTYDEHAANEALRSISPATIQLWEPAGASHTGALPAYPDEWERRVIGFLDASL
jgi:uncharacterized protein